MLPKVRDRLLEMANSHYNEVKIAALEALGESGVKDVAVIDCLLKATENHYNEVKIAAAKALGRLHRIESD
ncbi:HEAT repeat domain-containing protein [Pectobacterium brasiliense]|uniref:HEAT repeat domain-containing protein n=1 Tax=Pectobacterium brasiliense TaxID=180957 RepID=UPI0019696BB9|nr:HEAT repeat domain-containing protein [Pectobacterium brasiliense]MBN3122840.1 HEAT repeat domain-containing protein [Pectobacterium brasiliense]MBN3145084.1 HEAT repeat domain-containing protein [Pectobacterium brasiliense]QSD21246.1 HEAT repeat domain-containing protein [Pectobacterium brasiliense]